MQIPFEIIAVDFDGTLCVDEFPKIGAANWGLIGYLLNKQKQGARLILWTCRCDKALDDAVAWCRRKGLIFDAVNDNIPGLTAAMHNSNSRKVYADIYIDDKAGTYDFNERMSDDCIYDIKIPFRGEKNG
jgi:hypothetical protein